MGDMTLVNEWRRFAKMDYGAAIHLQGFHPLPLEIICFHCQQAAEKALKAVLVFHDEEVPYIHDTSRLWKLAANLEPSLSHLKPQADYLKRFATTSRYPSEVELSQHDMKQALQDAQSIIETVEALWHE